MFSGVLEALFWRFHFQLTNICGAAIGGVILNTIGRRYS